jgi:hypothetical protein
LVQITSGSITWRLVPGGSAHSVSGARVGGDVAVDNITLAASNQSIRYSSLQGLVNGGSPGATLFQETYNAANNLIRTDTQALIPGVAPGGPLCLNGIPLEAQVVTPLELNAINPNRLVIGVNRAVYESFDRGHFVSAINGPAANRNALAYGGRSGGVDNQDVLYVGSGSAALLRTTACDALAPTAALPAGAAHITERPVN